MRRPILLARSARGRRIAAAAAAAISCAVAGVVVAAAPAQAAAGAVVELDGCGDYALQRNDDGSSGLIELPFVVNFYGQGYDQAYVNNNGNITFDAPLGTFTPFGLVATRTPIIAPFFADVDTRGGAGQVTFGPTTYQGHSAFCVSWPGVGYYPNQVDKLNTFQLLLVERDATTHDFDIVFNYTFPYGIETMEVRSAGDRGMLWYELGKDRQRRQAQTQTQSQPQAVAQPQPVPLTAPSPSPGPAPTPAPADASQASSGGSIWAGIGGGLLIIGSGLLIVGTVAEDVATVGVGVLDDPFTIGGGIAGIGAGSSLVASMFGLAA